MASVSSGPGPINTLSTERLYSSDLDLFSAVFHNTTALLLILDSHGMVQQWNPACEALTGASLADIQGQPFADLFLPAAAPAALPAVPPSGHIEAPWLLADGRTRWIRWTETASGPLRIMTGIDITEQRETAAALANNQARQQQILETLPLGICVTAPDGTILLANQEGRRIWGPAAPAEPDQTLLPTTWSDDEISFHEMDGSSRTIQTQSIQLQDEAIAITASLMVSQDITQRKRVEEQLRQNENHARILAEISQALADVSLDYQSVLDTAVERVTELIGELGTIQVLSEDRQEILTVAVHHTDPIQAIQAREKFLATRSPTGAGIRAQVIASGLPVFIQEIGPENLSDEPNADTLPYQSSDHPANLLVVPLRVHTEPFGLLTLSRQQKNAIYTVDDLNFVLELAERIALAIENARLYSDNLRQREELEVRVARRTAEISVINQYLQLQLRERARVEEELSLFFDVALDMLCISTLDGYMTRLSPSWSKVLGWSDEELTSLPYLDLVHPEDLEMTLRANASLADGNTLVGMDNRFRCKDGSYRWISWNSVGLAERGIIIAAARDITDRKEAEQRLAEVLELNQKIIANAPVGIFAYRPNGECILANESSARIMDTALPQLREQNLLQIGAWQRTGLLKTAEQVLENGSDQRSEIHTFSALNRETWLECFLASFHSSGEPRLLIMANDITSRKKVEDELQYMATHDSLTGMPNRHLFQDRLDLALARARRNKQRLAVMLLDLDHFKQINDTFGHPVGDELLKIVSQRLTDCLRKSDTVARMGGDEFTFIFQEIEGTENVEVIAQKILTTVNQPTDLCGENYSPTASIGISLYPQQGDDADMLLKKADIAMYMSKKHRNRFTIFRDGS